MNLQYFRMKNSKSINFKLKENYQRYLGKKQSFFTQLEGCLLIFCLNTYPLSETDRCVQVLYLYRKNQIFTPHHEHRVLEQESHSIRRFISNFLAT